MIRRWFVVLPLLVACDETTESTSIFSAAVTCDEGRATFFLDVGGETPSEATVFSQETGNAEPNYSDEHAFPITAAGTLELNLTAGGAVNTVGETLFTCEGHHGFPDGVMTYAYRVYDRFGDLADCLVQGHDPDALIDGTTARVNDPESPDELEGCRVLDGVY